MKNSNGKFFTVKTLPLCSHPEVHYIGSDGRAQESNILQKKNEKAIRPGVKFAQQGSPISDKKEGLSYSAKSIEHDKAC